MTDLNTNQLKSVEEARIAIIRQGETIKEDLEVKAKKISGLCQETNITVMLNTNRVDDL